MEKFRIYVLAIELKELAKVLVVNVVKETINQV